MTENNEKSFWYRDDSRTTVLTAAETEIMRVVWDRGEPVTVRDVYETLRKRKRIAYTTVMSVMNKLARKGVLSQDRMATAYVYSATVSDIEVAADVLDAVVEKILAGVYEPLISRLLGSIKISEKQLKKIEALIKESKGKHRP